MSTLPIVLGRGLVYALIYAVTCTYILGLHYRLFHFPMNGATGAVMLFMAAYLAACIAMGIAVSTLFRYRENSLLLLLWTSIPVLMLSGVSYPRQGIPDWLFNLGQLFPSSHGLDPRGFRRNQVAHHPHGRLRRAGLHRHSPGDRPRTTGTSRPEGKRGRRALTAPYTRKKRRRILVRRLFCE